MTTTTAMVWMGLWYGPPVMALTYDFSGSLFQYAWYEAPGRNGRAYWTTQGKAILARLGLGGVVYALARQYQLLFTRGASLHEIIGSVAIGLLSLSLSYAAWQDTRTTTVQGGPAPRLTSRTREACKDKIVLITGANTGIGKETAEQLLTAGYATVILGCRSVQKGEDARRELLAKHDDDKEAAKRCWVLPLDLCSYASVRKAAALVLEKHPQGVDTLILNAGVMQKDFALTHVDKHEMVLQANHLGHYLLLRLLLPSLQQKQDARVLILTSSTYALCGALPRNDELQCPEGRGFGLFSQYAVSKLANILTAVELHQRVPTLFTAAIHPGLVRTQVVRNMPWLLQTGDALFSWFLARLQKTPAQGAWGTVHLATTTDILKHPDCDDNKNDPAVAPGQYWVNRRVQERLPQAQDLQAAKRLWHVSAELVGIEDDDRKTR